MVINGPDEGVSGLLDGLSLCSTMTQLFGQYWECAFREQVGWRCEHT